MKNTDEACIRRAASVDHCEICHRLGATDKSRNLKDERN